MKKFSFVLLFLTFMLSLFYNVECSSNGWEYVKVDSSFIYQIGYNFSQEILYVKFDNGKVYFYYDVPKKVYQEFKKASSKGRYFNSYIKGNYYYKLSDNTV